MARVCFLTGKKTISGNRRSHALNKSKRKFKPNLQKVRIEINGKPQNVYISVRHLKFLNNN